ncbi:ABC transporter permease [Colwelliaceae bacterium 6441]
MENSLKAISLYHLSFAFIPIVIVLFIFVKWSISSKRSIHALTQMLIQLLLVGYFLGFIFESNNIWLVGAILLMMVLFSSWIALSNIPVARIKLIRHVVLSILLSGGFTLLIITQGVLTLTPWYQAQVILPLAGMIFASCMNSISLSGERFFAESAHGKADDKARNIAFHAAMIPNINALFAVGIVSLPGMMTGQILSGVAPFIAARYQIMVMCMIFASAGLASACFLSLIKDKAFHFKSTSNPP